MLFESQMKENVPGIITNIPMENLPPTIHNFQPIFQAYGNPPVPSFPVKSMEIMEYPNDEKKQATGNNFPPFQAEGMKSSDSSFITGFLLIFYDFLLIFYDFF